MSSGVSFVTVELATDCSDDTRRSMLIFHTHCDVEVQMVSQKFLLLFSQFDVTVKNSFQSLTWRFLLSRKCPGGTSLFLWIKLKLVDVVCVLLCLNLPLTASRRTELPRNYCHVLFSTEPVGPDGCSLNKWSRYFTSSSNTGSQY